jgi:hypothetical protein
MLRICGFAAGVLAILSVGAIARADDTLTAPVTFSTIDQFERQLNQMVFVGILSGQSTETTLTLSGYPDNYTGSGSAASASATTCERQAMMMMSRPGRFKLTLTPDSSQQWVRCRLIRLTQ